MGIPRKLIYVIFGDGKQPPLHIWAFHELELALNTARGGFLVTVSGFCDKTTNLAYIA